MSDEGRNIEEIAADLVATRNRLRSAEDENKKLGALKRENERQKSLVAKEKEAGKRRVEENAHLAQKVSKLESELRAAGDLKQEIQQAEADRADALGEKEQAVKKLQDAQASIERLDKQLGEAKDEISRLERHEEHTRQLQSVIDLTKELKD